MIKDRHPSGTVMSAQWQRVLDKFTSHCDIDNKNEIFNYATESAQDRGLGVLVARIENLFKSPEAQQALVGQLAAWAQALPKRNLDELHAYCTSDTPEPEQNDAFIEFDLGVVRMLQNGPLPELIKVARDGQDNELSDALRRGADDWIDTNIIAVMGKRVELVSAAMSGIRGKVQEPWFHQAVQSGQAAVDRSQGVDGDTDLPTINQEDRDRIHEEMRSYLRDLILRLEEWKPLSLTQLRKTIDKIFIGHGWANPQVPNAKAFRDSLHDVAQRLMELNHLPKDSLLAECQILVAEAQRYTGLDVFTMESRGGFFHCNWETDYPSVLGHEAISRKELTVDTQQGEIVLGIEKEFGETIRSHRVDATLRDVDGRWLAICYFHIVGGPFIGADANANFVLAMDELDDTAAVIAHALSQAYGAEEIFRQGDLAILSHVEVREDHRGKGLGVRFLTDSLSALLERLPRIRCLAANIVPAQYEAFDNKELPKAIITQKTKDQRRLEQYFLANKERVVKAAGADKAPLDMYVFEEIAPPEMIDIVESVGAAAFDKFTKSLW